MPTYKKYATIKKVISQTNFDALDKSTLAVGEEYDIVAPIAKTDLDTSLQGSVDKAENALPKPTNDSSGTAGQILKKTLSGSEWADASGGVTVIEKSGTIPNASMNLVSISFTADEITTITNSFDTVVIKVTASSQTLELHPFNKTSATFVFASVSAGTVYYNLSIAGTTGVLSFYNPKSGFFPIGHIFISTSSTSPASTFGGTWEQIKDKFLLAAGDTYSANTTGGSANAVVVSHQHIGINWDNETNITLDNTNTANAPYYRFDYGRTSKTQMAINTSFAGESGTGKNMPPYITVYMWKRVS